MGELDKETVYKEIIFRQQELINKLIHWTEDGGVNGGGAKLPLSIMNELEDLRSHIETTFKIRKESASSNQSYTFADGEAVTVVQGVGDGEEYSFDYGAYEGSNARTSSLPPNGSSSSPQNGVRFDEQRVSSSIEGRSRLSRGGVGGDVGYLEQHQRLQEPPRRPSREDLPDSTHSAPQEAVGNYAKTPSVEKLANAAFYIPYVPERVSSTANGPQENEKASLEQVSEIVKRKPTDSSLRATEAPPPRDSQTPPIPPILFGTRIDSILEARPVKKSESNQSLRLITTANLHITPFKIQIKRGNPPSTQILSFTFKLSTENQVVGFIEKGRAEFVAIEQAIRNHFKADLVQSLGPFPEKGEFSGNANGKQTGALLQNWISNAIAACLDFPPLLEFLSSNAVPPPILKESFRKQGNLTKKGNYFGGWKTRHFNLDSASATVFYSDAKQSEILGSFSLQYAYAIIIPPQPIGQKSTDTLEKPGFIVAEYKRAQFLPNAIIQEGSNQDGLPLGKIDVRHVFYADSVVERDGWVRCLSGVIAKVRPNDLVAQELFAKTAAPEQRENNWPSLESLSNSARPSQINFAASSQSIGVLPTKIDTVKAALQESADKFRKGSIENLKTPVVGENKTKPARKPPATTTSANFPSSPTENLPTMPSTVTGATFPPISSPPTGPTDLTNAVDVNEDRGFGVRKRGLTVSSQVAHITQNATSPSRPSQSNRPKPRYIDDQTRCMQQELPRTLAEELDLSPTKAAPDTNRKKGGKGKFAEWMQKAAKSSADILKDRRETGKPSVTKLPLFGVTIQDAANASRIKPGIDIPIIVYRCIEYLDAKKAADEEGLYRLSGASSVITSLKQKFEEEGDVALLDVDEYYDPHAIAGLLKLFFRELSEPLFTFQLRMNFFQVAELPDRDKKIAGTIELLRLLPSANYACLRSLLAHLLRVVQKSDINKMTVRNVSIVFSPTLGVPAGLFTLMLAEFSTIFCWGPMDTSRNINTQSVEVVSPLPRTATVTADTSSLSESGDVLVGDLSPPSLNPIASSPSKKPSVNRNGVSPGFTFVLPPDAKAVSDEGPDPEDTIAEKNPVGLDRGEGSEDGVRMDAPHIPVRTVSQPNPQHSVASSSVNAFDSGDESNVISPSSLANRFLSMTTPEEELDMMSVLQKQLDSMDKS